MPKVIDETEIFDAVLDLLVAYGYEGATTQKIAERAGVNEVTLFRNYGSKAALFERAIDHQLADTPLSRPVYTGDVEADLISIVQAYIETNEQFGDIVPILLIEVPRHPDFRGALATPWRNLAPLMEILHKYQAQGVLRSESPFSSLNALIGPIVIGHMVRRANPEPSLPPIDPRQHVAAYLGGRKV